MVQLKNNYLEYTQKWSKDKIKKLQRQNRITRNRTQNITRLLDV